MLLQFSVENFLSFHQRATLSAIAAPDVEHLPGQTLPGPHGLRVLRTIAIYGANASGKSNLLKALAFAQRMVLEDLGPGAPIPIQPFRLDPEARQAPSHFELDFVAGGQHWSYGFLLSTTRVEAEWLFLRGLGDEEQLVFERTAPEGDSTTTHIEIGPVLQGKERERFEVFAESPRANRLLVGDLQGRSLGTFETIGYWLINNDLLRPKTLKTEPEVIEFTQKGQKEKTYITNMLKTADPVSDSIQVIPSDPEWRSLFIRGLTIRNTTTKDEEKTEIDSILSKIISELNTHHNPTKGKKELNLYVSRKTALFGIGEESLGTQQLLHLTPTFYGLTHADDPLQVACIDELERSLHPNLSRFLLQMLMETPEEEAGQLIFTTHDTNLLDLKLLSADGICFAEKDQHGASTLYTLAEFKPEQLEQLHDRLEEGYLAGRFGAVPFLGDPKRLGWTDARSKPAEDANAATEG